MVVPSKSSYDDGSHVVADSGVIHYEVPEKSRKKIFAKIAAFKQKQIAKRPLTKASFPPHYCEGRIEQIDVQTSLMSHEELRGSLWGNVIKYVMRWKFKGTPIRDLKKARVYLDWLIEHEEKGES